MHPFTYPWIHSYGHHRGEYHSWTHTPKHICEGARLPCVWLKWLLAMAAKCLLPQHIDNLVWQCFQHRLRDSAFFIYDNNKCFKWTKHFILVSALTQLLLAENRKTKVSAFFCCSREIARTPFVLSHLHPTQYGAFCMAPWPWSCVMAQDFKSQCFPEYRDLEN